jgi:hypothetical protein
MKNRRERMNKICKCNQTCKGKCFCLKAGTTCANCFSFKRGNKVCRIGEVRGSELLGSGEGDVDQQTFSTINGEPNDHLARMADFWGEEVQAPATVGGAMDEVAA